MELNARGVPSVASCVAVALVTCWSCVREPCQRLSDTRRAEPDSELALLAGDFQTRPRCLPSDPGCGPMPLRRSAELCFRPSSDRERLPERPDDPLAATDPRYDCRHDGECNVNGCGNMCTSYVMGSMASNCIGYDWLDEAEFCGCVESECAFFKQ